MDSFKVYPVRWMLALLFNLHFFPSRINFHAKMLVGLLYKLSIDKSFKTALTFILSTSEVAIQVTLRKKE